MKFLNTIAVDTDVLYVDTVNDRVGIGTTSPAAGLQVARGGATTYNLAIQPNGGYWIVTGKQPQ